MRRAKASRPARGREPSRFPGGALLAAPGGVPAAAQDAEVDQHGQHDDDHPATSSPSPRSGSPGIGQRRHREEEEAEEGPQVRLEGRSDVVAEEHDGQSVSRGASSAMQPRRQGIARVWADRAALARPLARAAQREPARAECPARAGSRSAPRVLRRRGSGVTSRARSARRHAPGAPGGEQRTLALGRRSAAPAARTALGQPGPDVAHAVRQRARAQPAGARSREIEREQPAEPRQPGPQRQVDPGLQAGGDEELAVDPPRGARRPPARGRSRRARRR